MNLTVDRLKELFVKLGGAESVVAGCSTIVEVLNAISAKYDGKDDAILNPDAISNITEIADKIGGGGDPTKNALIVEGVTVIGPSAFNVYGESGKITKVNVPGTVKKIGDYAFAYCGNLRDLTLAKGIEEIGESAFYQIAVENLVLPDGLQKIGGEAFGYILSLKSVSTDAKIIDNGAFRMNDGPDEDPHLPPYALVAVEKIELREGVESIGRQAFLGLKSETPLVLPNSIQQLQRNSFEEFYVDTIYVPFSISSELAQTAPWGAVKYEDGHYSQPTIVYDYTGA